MYCFVIFSYEPENCISLQRLLFLFLFFFSFYFYLFIYLFIYLCIYIFYLEENMINFHRQSTCSYVLGEKTSTKLQFSRYFTNA